MRIGDVDPTFGECFDVLDGIADEIGTACLAITMPLYVKHQTILTPNLEHGPGAVPARKVRAAHDAALTQLRDAQRTIDACKDAVRTLVVECEAEDAENQFLIDGSHVAFVPPSQFHNAAYVTDQPAGLGDARPLIEFTGDEPNARHAYEVIRDQAISEATA